MRNRSRRLLNAHFRSPNRLAADVVCEAFCRSIGADREHEDDAVKNCSGKHMLIGKQTAVRFVSNTVATCITRRSGGRPARSSDLTRGEQRDNQSQTEQVIHYSYSASTSRTLGIRRARDITSQTACISPHLPPAAGQLPLPLRD